MLETYLFVGAILLIIGFVRALPDLDGPDDDWDSEIFAKMVGWAFLWPFLSAIYIFRAIWAQILRAVK